MSVSYPVSAIIRATQSPLLPAYLHHKHIDYISLAVVQFLSILTIPVDSQKEPSHSEMELA